MRIVLALVGAAVVLAVVEMLRRRQARLTGPTLVQDLAAWDKAMPIAKPRQIFTGTQLVDRKALARALKGQKPKATATRRDFRIVLDDKRRLG